MFQFYVFCINENLKTTYIACKLLYVISCCLRLYLHGLTFVRWFYHAYLMHLYDVFNAYVHFFATNYKLVLIWHRLTSQSLNEWIFLSFLSFFRTLEHCPSTSPLSHMTDTSHQLQKPLCGWHIDFKKWERVSFPLVPIFVPKASYSGVSPLAYHSYRLQLADIRVWLSQHIYIYIYIYTERERESLVISN